MKYATLVYQGGMANVFSHEIPLHYFARTESPVASERVRLMQGSFRACENFAAGLKAEGVTVRSAWCNEAGDIIGSVWKFQDLTEAPFSDKFNPVN